MYKGKTERVNITLSDETRTIIHELGGRPASIINNALDVFLRQLQFDLVDSITLNYIKGEAISEHQDQRTMGTTTALNVRIRRQNVEFIRLNLFNLSRCVRVAIKRLKLQL